MKFGITFGRLNPGIWLEASAAADELGFESVWLPEHLVVPVETAGELIPGEEHPPIDHRVPVYDAVGYLCHLAARTTRVRLGTFVYLLGIRHPFVGARGFATLDLLSNGRAELGVGAGWLRTEWKAVGLDPADRGRRLDEAIETTRRLWTQDVIEGPGPHFPFEPVGFEPKPVQPGGPPISIGGESQAALERVARLGDGWLGMWHSPESAAQRIEQLRPLLAAQDRDLAEITVTVMSDVDTEADIAAFARVGVDRLIVTPWKRTRDALSGMQRFAERHLEGQP